MIESITTKISKTMTMTVRRRDDGILYMEFKDDTGTFYLDEGSLSIIDDALAKMK